MWYIGQRVVAVKDTKIWKKDQEFVIRGIQPCCKCYKGTVLLINHDSNTFCRNCDWQPGDSWYHEHHFAPIQSFGEEVTERISNEIEQEVEV